MSVRSELETCSARWGQDFLLVQGAGGNTSVKIGDRLIVKASGCRLSDAAAKPVFVDVALADGIAMARGGPTPATGTPMRASIETSLHAVLPQPVVAHLHMIPLIAFAVRADAEQVLAGRLAGLDWAFVPYVKPGQAVAEHVLAILRQGTPDILILGNHGLVVAGESFAAVDALVEEVRRRVEVPVEPAGAADRAALERISGRFGLEPARLAAAHRAALVPSALRCAVAGSLYPDHVVFLGRGSACLSETDAMPPAETALFQVAGAGALLAPGLPDEAHEMAACLAEVAIRVPSDAPLRLLTRAEEDVLINWDAELYRRNLANADR